MISDTDALVPEAELLKAQRQIDRLKRRLLFAKRQTGYHYLSAWKGLPAELLGSIRTATKLGYAVQAEANGNGDITFSAVKREDA